MAALVLIFCVPWDVLILWTSGHRTDMPERGSLLCHCGLCLPIGVPPHQCSVPGYGSHPHPRLFPGGLSLAIEGPSKAEISCTDNQDGTCSVSYLPVLPGDYSILVKYNEQHIPGSPFTARVTGGCHQEQ